MKRRKWWFAGLALALLAACVGVWNWSERPRYEFARDMDRVYAYVDPWTGSYVEVYSYAVDPRIAVGKAEKELISKGWNRQLSLMQAYFQFGFVMEHWESGSETVDLFDVAGRKAYKALQDGNNFGVRARPPLPPTAKGVIEISRTHLSIADRARVWLYGLRYNCPP